MSPGVGADTWGGLQLGRRRPGAGGHEEPPSHRTRPTRPADRQAPAGRRKENVLVDVTRRGGSGGWTAGGSDEDRCRLTPSTPTEFVFHRALAEAAWAAHHTRYTGAHTCHTGVHTRQKQKQNTALLTRSLAHGQRDRLEEQEGWFVNTPPARDSHGHTRWGRSGNTQLAIVILQMLILRQNDVDKAWPGRAH